MKQLIESIQLSLASNNYLGALFVALAMPDICASVESENGRTSGALYARWFEENLGYLYMRITREGETVYMTGNDCYALRCACLHNGVDDTERQRAREITKKFYFTDKGFHRIRINDHLVLSAQRFCEELCQAVERWVEAISDIEDKRRKLDDLIRVQSSFLVDGMALFS